MYFSFSGEINLSDYHLCSLGMIQILCILCQWLYYICITYVLYRIILEYVPCLLLLPCIRSHILPGIHYLFPSVLLSLPFSASSPSYCIHQLSHIDLTFSTLFPPHCACATLLLHSGPGLVSPLPRVTPGAARSPRTPLVTPLHPSIYPSIYLSIRIHCKLTRKKLRAKRASGAIPPASIPAETLLTFHLYITIFPGNTLLHSTSFIWFTIAVCQLSI